MPGLRNKMNHRLPESEELEAICRSTWKELYRFVYYRVQNREEAEDITQETYVKAFQYMERYANVIKDYRGYFKIIALNIIRDQWRGKKRRGQMVDIEGVDPEAMSIGDFSGKADDRAVLMEALDKLSKDQQTVISLRILQGFSAAETARLMNKKEGTVRVLQYRAIKALTKLLEGKG